MKGLCWKKVRDLKHTINSFTFLCKYKSQICRATDKIVKESRRVEVWMWKDGKMVLDITALLEKRKRRQEQKNSKRN